LAADYVLGQSLADNIYRLYGDLNGNRVMDLNDLIAMIRSWRSTSKSVGYVGARDLDGNGMIGANDYMTFRRNFRRRI